jgi:hypothetical protein
MMQIESYRTRLEEFEQNLNRELYRHCAGLKPKLETVSIYADYSDFFCTENILEVESALRNESFESRRKSLGKILQFLMDQYLELRAVPLDEEMSNTKQTLMWEGREIRLSQVSTHLRTEPNALSRRKLYDRQLQTLGEFGELKLKKLSQLRAAADDLGFENYIQARERISGVQYERLLSSFEEVFERLGDRYLERFRISLETTLGIPLQETGSWDLAYWEEKNEPPGVFMKENLLGAVESIISALAIRFETSEAVSIDLDRRSGKQPGAFCIPIRIPQEIKVVMTPGDGSRHYAALLHECGHAYHFAWTSPSLLPEHRFVGDRALSESYAFLLEYFLQEWEWLARKLYYTRSESFLRFQALHRIFLIRRCLGKLRFGLKLHTLGSLDDAPRIYSETMGMYTGLQYPPESWLADFSDPFASADYLRGWVFEALLREYLRTKYGRNWAEDRAASGFLKEIWETGLLYSADELCREIGIGVLDPQVLADTLLERMGN